ncbi:MAG: sugar phosphate isomerase/epimerase family protein [Planctomycetaceae bacterium]
MHRRTFLAASALALAGSGRADGMLPSTDRHEVCVFTKPFNSLSFDELADRIAELGFDGIEAPVRKGGHIEPQAVPEQLPKLVEALKKRGLTVTVMATDINDPGEPLTESVLKTASDLGIPRYRMKYFQYDERQPILPQLQSWKSVCTDLAAMNAELGISAVYQNHAGRGYMGAALWDLQQVLDGIDPNHIGVAYDIRHASVEGGMSWPVTFRMIRPHVTAVYVKDFRWIDEKVENVPLGEGQVDPKFFDMLRETNFTGPVSLHEEYLDHNPPELVPRHLAAIATDFAVLKRWLQQPNA